MDSKSQRPMALVTGASSGIGEAYAQLLANHGFDLWLVARRKDRLDHICQKLSRSFGVDARATVCDLSDRSQVKGLCDELEREVHLEVMVHNAGFGVHGEIGQADPAKLMAMVDVHVSSTIALCSQAVPILKRRGKGAIVVVSSIAGSLTGAGSATYCATKAFETSFTKSLAKELKPFGVNAQALCPGYTRTEFHDTPEYADWQRSSVPKILWSTPSEVVERSWACLGHGNVCIPGTWNRLIVAAGRSETISRLRERFRAARGR